MIEAVTLLLYDVRCDLSCGVSCRLKKHSWYRASCLTKRQAKPVRQILIQSAPGFELKT